MPEISMNSSWRVFFAVLVMTCASLLIAWIVLYGDPKNALHQTALLWCFIVNSGVLVALGFGGVVTAITSYFQGRPNS